MAAKDRHKVILLEWLGDPENEWLRRKELSTHVLGFSKGQQIHNVFSAAELNEIENEALELRRSKYSGKIAEVDSKLFEKAISGDHDAIKLVYEKFDGLIKRIHLKADVNSKSTMEAGSGLLKVLSALGEATTGRKEISDQGSDST